MNFEEVFKSWTLDQKVEWALGPNICNLSENMRSIIVDLKAENERLNGAMKDKSQVHAEIEATHIQRINTCIATIKKLRKENAKLRCLALHAMCRWLDSWSIGVGINIMKHRKFGLFEQIKRHLLYYRQAYCEAKKALMDGK